MPKIRFLQNISKIIFGITQPHHLFYGRDFDSNKMPNFLYFLCQLSKFQTRIALSIAVFPILSGWHPEAYGLKMASNRKNNDTFTLKSRKVVIIKWCQILDLRHRRADIVTPKLKLYLKLCQLEHL